MSTRKRDAERRQVSLAVEALEDRFLLSGLITHSVPAATNGPSFPPVAEHISTVFPLHATMSYQRDNDGKDDLPGMTDRDDSGHAFFGYPLFCSPGSHAAGCLDFELPTRLPEQMALPAVSPMSFFPLLSASGLGAASIGPFLPIPSPTAVSESAPGNHDPDSGKEKNRPIPAVPPSPPSAHSPLVQEPADALPSSPGGPFAGLLPIDTEAIRHGVEAFFQQLSDLSEEWREGRLLEKLAPWLLVASVAGYGWIRLRDRGERRLADLLGCDRPETVPFFFLPREEG